MKSLFALTWAVCLSVCLALVPNAVFAQSTGTFTVNKSYTDDGVAQVDVTLTCTNGYGPVEQTTSGLTTMFNIGSGVFASNWGGPGSPTTCTAIETPVPTGYKSDEAINCAAKTLTEATPGNGGTAAGGCFMTNTPVCGDSIVDAGEDCDDGDISGGCCSDTCQFESGSFTCDFADGFCDIAEFCTGASAVCPADGANLTGVCRPSADLCDPAESCSDASDDCPVDVPVAAEGVECRPVADVCDVAETCDGTSATCPVVDVFIAADAHTECRAVDGSGDGCDVAEVCAGTGAECPADDWADEGTLCGVVPDFSCDPQDTCTGTADECIPNPDPEAIAACGVIGKGDGCELNICDGEGPSDFKLLFTPDLPNWVSYKLNASNPGQLFYTLVSEPDVLDNSNLLLQIPFPFVTQGNMTLHVYDGDDVAKSDECNGLVIAEDAPSDPYPVEITMDSYWNGGVGDPVDGGPYDEPGVPQDCTEPSSINPPTDAGAYCKHMLSDDPEDYVLACPSDYDPNYTPGEGYPPALALQECWAYYPVQLENVGQFAARLHLDYGLKGKHLDTYCPADGNVDRYAPGGALAPPPPLKSGDWGFNALGIDVNESSTSNYWLSLSECNIPTCQPYTFAQGVESDQPSDCYSAHGGAGCDDAVCEAAICGGDAYCCDTEWDNVCASAAAFDAVNCFGDPVPVDPAESVVESFNEFKKPVGIFGRAFCEADESGYLGLKVKMYKAGSSTVLAQATTDEDGMYFLNYKHKGKAVYYRVKLFLPNATELKATWGTGNPGDVPLQANGFAEQNFHNSDPECDAADPVWTNDAYEITKGKFKTIVP